MRHPSMVTLINPSPSPTSIQLRFGLLCRNSAHAPLRVRFWKSGLDRGGRGFLVRCVGARNGKERHSSSTPHVSPVDSFSGWSEDDSDGDGDGDSGEKKGYGGILGAGLAGMFLTASFAFASISLSSKRSIGMKQQMKPLTSQQEVLLCSDDDQNDKASFVEDKSNVQLPKCGVEIPKSDILEDSISESSLSVKQTQFHQVNSSSSEDLPGDPDSKCSSSESLLPNSSVVTELKDLTEMDDIATTSISELSSYSPDVADLNSGNQDDGSTPSELESSKVSNKASSQLSSETLNVDTSIDSESNATLDPQPSNDLSHQVDIDLGATHELENEKIDKSLTGTILTMDEKEVVLVKETITSSLDQSSLTGIGLPEANKVSDSDKLVETISSLSPSDSIEHNSSFSHAGIPAPSLVSPALQVTLGKVLVPAVIDQIQGHAFSAMQVLKVIEGDVQPCDICTRRQYARWLVSASGAHSRNTISKVYPAMYIENMTELAFDDITPDDPDFSCIQGLAEAGLISNKLTCSDTNDVKIDEMGAVLFSPESPLSRQDLVCWKMALERRHLPEVDRKAFHQHSGYIDMDKISTDAWPAIVADLSSGESGIIPLAFGYTRLFQPQKPVTNAQAAIALSTGDLAEVVGEELTRIEADSLAETAVAAHTALVAEVEKELNASFEKELSIEREKNVVIEKLAEEATSELKNLRLERDEEYNSLIRGRAAVESEMEVLSRLRNELEEQLHSLISKKMEITFERDRINNLRMEAENENQTITQLQFELEIERKALSMARAWAEDEAKKAREQGKALEEARKRWERHGIKVIVDDELRESSSAIVTFVDAGKQKQVEEATDKSEENILVKFKSRSQNIFEELKVRAKKLVEKLKILALQVKGKSSDMIQRIIQKIVAIISTLKQQFSEASQTVTDKQTALISKAIQSMQELKDKSTVFSSDVKDGAKKTVEDFKETLEKITKRSKAS